MIQSIRSFPVLMFVACLSLAACGGGGGSSSSMTSSAPSQVPPSTGTVTSTNPAFAISGVVSGITGVSVALSGDSSNATTTDSGGNFSFAGLAKGGYTVTPSHTGYLMTPVSRAATLTAASVTDVTFAASASSAATYTLSGTVAGSVTAGVVVTLNGVNIGSAVTDLSGNYTFAGLVSGTYTVSAALDGYSFTAPLIVSLGNVDSASNNFTAAATSTAGNLAFTPVPSLPQAVAGSPYSATVVQSVSGGTAPYHYQSGDLAAGAPPLGMIVNPNGNLTGTPDVPGLYMFEVCASDSAHDTSPCQATSISVVPAQTSAGPAPTVSLAAAPATIISGASAVLSWSSKNATSCAASGGWTGTEATSGSATVAPKSTTTYNLTCTGPNGTGQASAVVTVDAAAPAPTVNFTASATAIPSGTSAMLKWTSRNATSCAGSGGWTGTETPSGTRSVTPTSTTSYGVTCSGAGGSAKASVKITVDAAAPPPAPTVSLTAKSNAITSGSSSTLTWSSTNAASCTASGAWTGTEGLSGTQSVSPTSTATYTLVCAGGGGKTSASATVTVSTGTTPPATGTSWVYYDGLMDWPGDYSFAATPDYHDTQGAPLTGKSDVKVTVTAPYGGWLPYAQNWNFNSKPYTKLTFALKPTVANQSWSVFFIKVGDVPVGIGVDVSNYGPKPVAGEWATYTIPLADLGVLGTSIYKFSIQDKTGLASNEFYVDNVGFAP